MRGWHGAQRVHVFVREFVRETAAGKAAEAQCAVAALMTLPLPAQAKCAVPQGSLQHKVAHLPRVARMALVLSLIHI